MLSYAANHYDKLLAALLEHMGLVLWALALSLVLTACLSVLCMYWSPLRRGLVHGLSILYSIPSLAMFAMMIPLTGLGTTTAVIVLVAYNQYLLLQSFLTGLADVDPAVTDAAAGMGMTTMQILLRVRLPLARRALFAGIRIAAVSTIGIATIAASINAGGLGTILFDGLRTMNVNKIVWGSLLSAGLAIAVNAALGIAERKYGGGN